MSIALTLSVMSTLTAARAQMVVTLAFHIVFAAVGIGLPWLLVLVEGRFLRTGDEACRRLAHKWAKATGLLFAVGAVSGTALALELGLLWPRYIMLTGAVVGHLFALEGYAFFLEAIFIGLYLYGWDRISPRAHWWCGLGIAVTGTASGILVLGVNSWMQQPVGFDVVNGQVVVTDPAAILKRYGWLVMAVHSTLACTTAVAFAVAAVYASGWLRGRRDAYHRSALRAAMLVGGVSAVLQPLSGDGLAKFVFQTQHAKFAAMEGQFATQGHAPLRIGGLPDPRAGRTRYAIEIPGGLSFLAAHDFWAVVPGLDSVPRSDWPNLEVTHFSFQAMVGIGTALMLLSIWFWAAWWRCCAGRSSLDGAAGRWLLRALVLAGPLGFLALEAGWMVTEVGRQPWVINRVPGGFAGLRTADAVTPSAGVQPTFYAFTLLYLLLGVTVVALLLRLRTAGHPEAPEEVTAPQEMDLPEGAAA